MTKEMRQLTIRISFVHLLVFIYSWLMPFLMRDRLTHAINGDC